MSESPTSRDRGDRAAKLFQQFVGRVGQGDEVDFTEFCAQHSEYDAELRRLHADWEEFQSALALDIGDTVDLSRGKDEDVWDRFIDQLRSRGPVHTRYVLKGEIARGGMGVVHRVYDNDVRRPLAMKVILGQGDAEPSGETPPVDSHSLGRFLEEAQVTGQLDHPGIVPVHELGVDAEGRVYFTMKLVKGEDLRSVFDSAHDPNDEEWNQTRALSVLLRVCEAMVYAHTKGVIHRDLKPANVMVGKFGETYVMDWGLARILGREDGKDIRIRPEPPDTLNIRSERTDSEHAALDSPILTMDGDVVGTPSYMAPEQAEGRLDEIGPHSDVYSAAAMLYHLLTGSAPYTRTGARISPRSLLAMVLQGPPTPIHQIAPDVPAELQAICEKGMARDIRDRYGSMHDLARDLRAYLEHRVVAAYESGPFAELKKWVLRNRALAAVGLAALLGIAVFATWAFSERNTARASEKLALAQKSRADQNAVRATRKATEAAARKAEFDQLAGVVYLEEALSREKELYPPWPETIAAMETWLAHDAARLAALRPQLTRTLADLERRAAPPTEEERERDRRSHPRYSALTQFRAWVVTLRRSQAVRNGAEPLKEPPLPSSLVGVNAEKLDGFAWSRATPFVSERIFGEEPLAITTARAALQRVDAGDSSARKCQLFATLAWALFYCGRDSEALDAMGQAIAAAPEDEKRKFRGFLNGLEEAIEAVNGEFGVKALAAAESKLATLEAEVSRPRTFYFEQESQRFLHTALLDLSTKLDLFEQREKPRVVEHLAWARQIETLTHDHPNARVTWNDARAALAKADGIVASKLYAMHPLDLSPQIGLIPIGMNPATKLWEFYELRSAYDPSSGTEPEAIEIPVHADDGSIEVREETGIVFVLIPGGNACVGSQDADPTLPNYCASANRNESPVHGVQLSPFLLARHELTVAQWKRLSGGELPSWHTLGTTYEDDPVAIGWTHPVESVSWEESRAVLRRQGLTLPTEAQWEYGARGMTSTPWWTGSEPSSLEGAANILDRRAIAKQPNWGEVDSVYFNDGFTACAPVGRFRANPFGLYDVNGNVREWCLDWRNSYTTPTSAGNGLRQVAANTASACINRGGSYNATAFGARSAGRHYITTSACSHDLGVRPARELD